MKGVVYTVIVDDYDDFSDPMYVQPGFDYVCFTNNPKLANVLETGVRVWTVVPVEGDGVKFQRHIKIRPDLYLSNYDFSVYADANIVQVADFQFFLDDAPDCDILTVQHPWRNCLYDEAQALAKLGTQSQWDTAKATARQRFGNPFEMDCQVEQYRTEKYPAKNGLISSGLLFRHHLRDNVVTLMEAWDDEVKEHTHRDQLSFDYCFWKHPVKRQILPWSAILDSPFKRIMHRGATHI